MFMPEVTLHGRRADALYVGFFQSRGKYLVGHEVKASRADWLHELEHPAKAEVWFRECHSWYLVVPHESIVRDGELPTGWGLMVPGKSVTRMRVVVPAEQRIETQPSWAATHAIVQRADSLRMAAIADAEHAARESVQAEVERRVEAREQYSPTNVMRDRAERAEALLREVEGILGVRVIDGESSFRSEHVALEELRSSFARWLAADAAVRSQLPFQRGAVARVRQAAAEAEKALEALVQGSAS
jgi:hypothetical protein